MLKNYSHRLDPPPTGATTLGQSRPESNGFGLMIYQTL